MMMIMMIKRLLLQNELERTETSLPKNVPKASTKRRTKMMRKKSWGTPSRLSAARVEKGHTKSLALPFQNSKKQQSLKNNATKPVRCFSKSIKTLRNKWMRFIVN